MTTPLENLAMIGDGETVALISSAGSIEWLCLPRFDSAACCARLVGNTDHGHWTIGPEAEISGCEQRYQDDTLILETDMHCADGAIRVTDFMPVRDHCPLIVRIVEGLDGTVPTVLTGKFRFDYGRMPPWITLGDKSATMHVGPDKLVLCGLGEVEHVDGTLTSRFEVKKGERHVFTLGYSAAHEEAPEPPDADKALKETRQYWEEWISRFDRPVPYEREVRRSLLILKALIHRPTGGLVAAATTSLPERPGGELNWDYRYCWLRDAAFTLHALIACGYLEEATAWRDWILRAVGGAEDKMQIMYRVDGSRRLDEAVLDWLPGYRFSKPVRIGNAAAGQFQLDVFGEMLNMLHTSEQAGMERTEQGLRLERSIIDQLESAWKEPDHGIWEDRGKPRHYVASKVMAWVAFDRFLKGSGCEQLSRKEHARLTAVRDRLHEVICIEGYSSGLNSFTSYFGGQTIDASLLLLPMMGFLPMSDERMAGTVARIENRLLVDGLVRRHESESVSPEGAFLACGFWLAECQLMDDRREDAARMIERTIAVASPLGLLSEEYDPACKRLNGNFPQALSHLALISAVLALDAHDRR
ncbi:glycoside hydrolase family 15 protein [Pararhizobium mangrovi]|uniref:Glycoside hydrolase family 15 protein n=1 Tax=Pararhizobium mangrovi TaxID=2590452 RepID=A0A506U5I0_9HYPH|nr:glycoside hydrolase family 15 protein [Pararhizobium mangrovi]TPW29613.1 glycoside hydrolase family 15 protein [Pararhizobium mangrovi]